DTQVEGMRSAIERHHLAWLKQTKKNYPGVKKLEVVVGLTYGTPRTTNNKENQILVKLLGSGFKEADRARMPGKLVDVAGSGVHVSRVIGIDYWAFVGNPKDPASAEGTFLEILVALGRGLSTGM